MPDAKRKPISEKEVTARLEGLWLNYYNDTLYARGVITEAERNKMRNLVRKRTAERAR